MNLVAGATGILGMEVCRLLAGRGKPVAGLVRRSSNPEKLNQLARMDVRRVEGDITDRGTLDAACQGVQTLISTATATPQSRQSADTIETVDFTGQINLVDAAKAAGAAVSTVTARRLRASAVTRTSPSASTSSLSCTSGMIREPCSSLRRKTRSRKMSTATTRSGPRAAVSSFPSLGKRRRAVT
jgi:uncharacterized protein YbjT (DUF2867 family)